MAPKILIVLTSQKEIPSLKKPTGWYLVRPRHPNLHPATINKSINYPSFEQAKQVSKLKQNQPLPTLTTDDYSAKNNANNNTSPNSPTPMKSSTKRPS